MKDQIEELSCITGEIECENINLIKTCVNGYWYPQECGEGLYCSYDSCLSLTDILTKRLIELFNLTGEVEVFRLKKSVKFPLDDEGNIDAVVHEKLQNKDYQPLRKGDPLFITLSGKTVTFEENSSEANDEFYPIFVNEAAYYPQHIAFSLTEKIYVDVQKGL